MGVGGGGVDGGSTSDDGVAPAGKVVVDPFFVVRCYS